MTSQTLMRREIDEIPGVVRRIMSDGLPQIAQAAEDFRALSPSFILTVARGSSDHAAHFLKYAAELLLGIPVASIGPSIASVYNGNLAVKKAACLAISQSGRSPDILALTDMLQRNGASVFALVNDPASPLAAKARRALDISAGPERSVPATKSFVASLVSGLALIALCARDDRLIEALHMLPGQLEQAIKLNWPELRQALKAGGPVFVLGRGPGLAIAGEAALKLKETCGLHAEAYSTAEVRHGPIEVIGPHFTSLSFAVQDAATASVAESSALMLKLGAMSFVASSGVVEAGLATIATENPLTDFIAQIATFYSMAEALASEMGRDPDRPKALQKVTATV